MDQMDLLRHSVPSARNDVIAPSDIASFAVG
jgi:hypothetical protein